MTEAGGGGYREYAPPSDLRAHVACTWAQHFGHAPASEIPIIPDGCVDIVRYGDEALHIAGPASSTQLVAPSSLTIVGIRLRPGAAQAVLGCPMASLLNDEARLLDVCGRHALGLQGLPYDADQTRAALADWVRARLASNRRSPAALHAASAIVRDPLLPLDTLLQQLDISARQLHRELTAACGYGPKLLQRIMRVQRTLRIAAHGTAHLPELALRAGYADQAHMTRDFRALTGTTPARYLPARNPAVGGWLDDD